MNRKFTSSKIKIPRVTIIPIIIIIVGIIGLILVVNNIIPISDSKTYQFDRFYMVQNITESSITEGSEENDVVFQAIVGGEMIYSTRLVGKIDFETTSRSVNNPIEVRVTLKQSDKPTILFLVEWERLPEKLHYVFPGALKHSNLMVESGKEVEIELIKNDKDSHYFGSEKIIYKDSGEYDFYLKEAKENEEYIETTLNDDGTIKIGIYYPLDGSLKLGARFLEINLDETKKLVIEPYGQTIGLESYKLAGYFGFAGMIITGVLALRKIKFS